MGCGHVTHDHLTTLCIKLKRAGYEPEGGRLLRDRKMVPVPVERTVFAMAGVRYTDPAMR